MKSRKLMTLLAGFALLNGCSGGGTGSAGSGGSGNGSGGSSSGGSVGSGGGNATGGSGSGGQVSSGGSTSTGGASSGGSTATGGSSSTGGSATGGATGSGGTTASGGSSSGGAGGKASSGGAGGGTASGGSAGGAMGGGGSTGMSHWVGTWTASPYLAASDAQPPAALSNSVLRQVAHVSLGGSQIRVQFSNLSGNGSVAIKSAHVAICKATGAVDSTIDTATDKALAFSGMETVTIAQGKEVWSDPVDFTVGNQGNISITTALGTVPSNLTAHSGSRTTSYQVSGSTDVSPASMASAKTTDHWYFISGIDVMADAAAGGVVAIGDSITDGRGTDTNKNNRWTDILAARLQMNAATAKVSMMNQGIGATNLVGTGTAAQARFARDVLGQSGVKYVIVFDAVNDIHGGASVASMKSVYDKMISDAHAKGLKIFGATITPFGGSSDYYTASAEQTRKDLNTYIKSGAFDGVIDFDAAITDGGNPPKIQTALAAWSQMDGLHPGPAGYQKMGDSVDLTLFTK